MQLKQNHTAPTTIGRRLTAAILEEGSLSLSLTYTLTIISIPAVQYNHSRMFQLNPLNMYICEGINLQWGVLRHIMDVESLSLQYSIGISTVNSPEGAADSELKGVFT